LTRIPSAVQYLPVTTGLALNRAASTSFVNNGVPGNLPAFNRAAVPGNTVAAAGALPNVFNNYLGNPVDYYVMPQPCDGYFSPYTYSFGSSCPGGNCNGVPSYPYGYAPWNFR
jgi:hypothetical protein